MGGKYPIPEWIVPDSEEHKKYLEIMALRSAYTHGYVTDETKQACREYMRIRKRRIESGELARLQKQEKEKLAMNN